MGIFTRYLRPLLGPFIGGKGSRTNLVGGGGDSTPSHPVATYLLRVSENLAHAETNARMSGYLYKSSQTA